MELDLTGWLILATAATCFLVVGFGLKTGKILGIAFRGRLIARRKEEPGLFGCSIMVFAVFGLFLIFIVASTALRG